MIVDDSITARTVFSRLFDREPGFSVVAQAGTAEQAIDQLCRIEADVILLDLEMPGMGGLKALPDLIAAGSGARVLVVSSHAGEGAGQTVAALAMGAADTVRKPSSGQFDMDYRRMLLDRVRALAQDRARPASRNPLPPAHSVALRPAQRGGQAPLALAIGASTGGIHALTSLFRALPARIGIPILVTQHLPASFLPAFVRQLESATGRDVSVAQCGMAVSPDEVVVAPGDASIVAHCIGGTIRVRLDPQRSDNGCLPSVDPMFESLARGLGGRLLGVVLTGMGRDGAAGAAAIARAGGTVLVQDAQSSAVWGMPRAVAEAGHAQAVLPPGEIALRIAASVGGPAWK